LKSPIRFGERAVVRIVTAAEGGLDADLRQPLGVAHREVRGAAITVVDPFAGMRAESVAETFPRKVFITEMRDPQRHSVTFTWDAQLRLVAAADAVGQVTTIAYEHPTDPLKIYAAKCTRFEVPKCDQNRKTMFAAAAAGTMIVVLLFIAGVIIRAR
jgi:YD repeat-containing protein